MLKHLNPRELLNMFYIGLIFIKLVRFNRQNNQADSPLLAQVQGDEVSPLAVFLSVMATSHHSSHFEGQKCQVFHQSSNTVSQPFGPLWSNFNTPLNRFLLSRSEFNQLACSTWQTSLFKMASLFGGPLWTLIQDKNIEIVWLTHGMINVSNIQSS